MTIDDDRFAHAVNIVLAQEGGYSDDPDDPGGVTNFGITKKFLIDCGVKFYFLKGKPPESFDMKTLTRDEAILIYRRMFWNTNNFGSINSLPIAAKMLSLAVNMGSQTANKLLQTAVNSLNNRRTSVDGFLGARTLALVNITNTQKLLDELKLLAVEHYVFIVEQNPELAKYLQGWKNRANS